MNEMNNFVCKYRWFNSSLRLLRRKWGNGTDLSVAQYRLRGTLGRCLPPIFFVLTYVVVLKKLSDFFFLSARIGFLGVKTVPENGILNTHLNCFTYNSVIFHNETKWKNFFTMKDEKCDFLKFVGKFLWGWTTPKLLKQEWIQVKKFGKNICCLRWLKFTYFCIFRKN